MRRVLRTTRVIRWATVIAAIVLTLALSLCAFDRDEDGIDDGMDICAIALVSVAGVILLPTPVVIDSSIDEGPLIVADASPRLPDPPPKPALAV